MGYFLLVVVTFFLPMFAVASIARRRSDITSRTYLIRAGCIPSALGSVILMLLVGAMGGDPSAGLGMLMSLLVVPFAAVFLFGVGAVGGAIGLAIAKRK